MSVTWAFGYGSLVSPESLSGTLGRPVRPGEGWAVATLRGWGRRWNYGVGHWTGRRTDLDPTDPAADVDWTIVALGVVPDPGVEIDGVVVAVTDEELARLDHRERHYDRVDVTAATAVAGGDGPRPGPRDRVITYVPRPDAVARYERARAAGRAAIETRYWDLVTGAFAALGEAWLERFHASTPDPDVPVLPLARV